MTTKQGGGNPLAEYFDALDEGPGVWKWLHYFEHYHHHFQRFVGTRMNLLEIGVYSGGSLGMWKHYFGSDCRIVGVDIEPTCKQYEDEQVEIIIGDQDDGQFWGQFKSQLPTLDIVIDDGSHRPEHQLTTFLELLPHMRPGGVYFCEDIHGTHNMFGLYLHQLSLNLNACQNFQNNPQTPERRSVSQATEFQSSVHSIHFYPYVAVVECNKLPIKELVAPKRGTHWQPYME